MNTTADLITTTCDCGAKTCTGVVIEITETRLAAARTPKERATMIHNYVINRTKMAMFGKLRIVKG